MVFASSFFQTYLNPVLLVIAVIFLFNLMIFVHELGHFWVARWRGLYVDRFQIWFGKPLWKKKINGVEWGLGWIPAGGFVSLPQLAPMDAIEGEVDEEGVKEFLEKNGKPSDKAVLPEVKPLDKIIVAFAGPLFSFLLAVVFALIVWVVGKPTEEWKTTTIGYIDPSSLAVEAGFKPGDKIIAIDGHKVNRWMGNMEDGVRERIMLSENAKVQFTIERPGVSEPLEIESGYRIPEKEWWERRAMRQVGVGFASKSIVGDVLPESPADKAGLKKGDEITKLNGEVIWSPEAIDAASKEGKSIEVTVKRAGEEAPLILQLTPALPINASEIKDAHPMIGVSWAFDMTDISVHRLHPKPWEQIGESLKWMKITLQKIAASGSDIGVQHLSGPVGIGRQFYVLLSHQEGWALALWFAVVLNINLAVLNLLPLPVVDGGHIVLNFIAMIRGKEVSGKILEWIQVGFVFVLLFFFLFVTSKDVGDLIGSGKEEKQPTPVFVLK